MTIPKRTNRKHYMPYWYGDSPRAVKRASTRRKDYIDQNYNLSADDIPMAMHWGDLRRNGFKYLETNNGYRRKLTKQELNQQVSHYDNLWLKRLRRTKKAGRSYRSVVRPHSWWEMLKYYKAFNVTPCPELKAYEFGTNTRVAHTMYKQAREAHVTAYPMTLVTMRGWGIKMRTFHQAGFETALLPHGAKKPVQYNHYKQWIDEVWGRWHR